VLAGVTARISTDLPIDLSTPQVRIHGDDAYIGAQIGGDAVIYRSP